MSKKEYHKWSKDKLVHEIKTLLKRKKFGLVWEDKDEDVATKCEDFLPVLSEVKKKKLQNYKNDLQHIIIEGDNYHALSTLCYTHKKKIDVIYIDPPYNTGNKSWIYNNNYVEKDDRFPHSKWLSFMKKRLVLAKNVLSKQGAIIVAIDHYELFNLGVMCDEIFGEENRLGVIAVVHKPEGRNQEKFFSTSHEYMLVYAKIKSEVNFKRVILDEDKELEYNKEDDEGRYKLNNYLRSGGGNHNLRKNKPHFFYPIYVSKDLKNISLKKQDGFIKILPITKTGQERTWQTTKETFEKRLNSNQIIAEKDQDNEIQIYEKYREDRGQLIKTHWIDKKYNAIHYGTKLLENILGGKIFDYPKSLYLVSDILKIFVNKDSTILDFFAGSGTTGHAVLELNKEDGGNRQFILCTNNENNNGYTKGIAEGVCYPRIEKVINGYTNLKKQKIEGLGGNLRYYKTDFVNQVRTDTDKRKLVNKSTEMLCLTENTFNKVMEEKDFYAIFENSERMTGIIYDEDAIDDFNNAIKKFNKPLSIYVFSYDHTYNQEDFADIKNLVEVKPIPEVILNVYRKIFKNIRKSKTL